jgi:hypothetical protein
MEIVNDSVLLNDQETDDSQYRSVFPLSGVSAAITSIRARRDELQNTLEELNFVSGMGEDPNSKSEYVDSRVLRLNRLLDELSEL